MVTTTFGGLVRDVVCKRDVRILHSKAEIYASTALSGATMYMLTRGMGAPTALRIISGMGTAMGMRYAASNQDIKLPRAPWYKETH